MFRGIRPNFLSRLLVDPKIQAITLRNTFAVADRVILNVDFDDADSDYRRIFAEGYCNASEGRWRRCIIEREGNAVIDQVRFEFEYASDADQLRSLITRNNW